jgi:hypothetical protein
MGEFSIEGTKPTGGIRLRFWHEVVGWVPGRLIATEGKCAIDEGGVVLSSTDGNRADLGIVTIDASAFLE